MRIVVPHPHDIVIAKLERLDPQDVDHVRRVLAELPLTEAELDARVAACPPREGEAATRFARGVDWLRRQLRG